MSSLYKKKKNKKVNTKKDAKQKMTKMIKDINDIKIKNLEYVCNMLDGQKMDKNRIDVCSVSKTENEATLYL